METIKHRIENILSQLSPRIDDYIISGEHHVFSDGGFYIQQIPEVVEKAQRDFLDLCYEVTKNKIFIGKCGRQGVVGRYLNDGNPMLYKSWQRFVCIDEEYREWGQPYFAITKSEHNDSKICLNLIIPELRCYFINDQRDKKLNTILNS